MTWLQRLAGVESELNLLPSVQSRREVWLKAVQSLPPQRGFPLLFVSTFVVIFMLMATLGTTSASPFWEIATATILCGLATGALHAIISIWEVYSHRRQYQAAVRSRLNELGHPVCMSCGYSLQAIVSVRCPECGHAFDAEATHRGCP